MGDQPTTCPKCETRTELFDFLHTNAKWIVNICYDEECGFTFFEIDDGEEDFESDEEDSMF